MKLIAAMLILICVNAQSQSLTRVEHTLRNGTATEIARMLSIPCSKKKSISKVKELIYLLNKPGKPTKVKGSVNSHDVLILMLSRVTDIPVLDKEKAPVKAIISFQNKDGKVFRYHIIKVTNKEKRDFTNKVKMWLQDKSRA